MNSLNERRTITQFDGKRWIKIEPKWIKDYRPATRYVQL